LYHHALREWPEGKTEKVINMSNKSVTVSGVEISVGDVYVNDANGGQEVTVIAVDGNPASGNIVYRLENAFKFGSLEQSATDGEIFLRTFRKK
jgi:hypothetical protein